MSTPDIILPKSLQPVVDLTNQAVATGEIAAIAARAGVGKTSFLVQVALHAMLSGQNILHINLNDPLKKVVLWYKEVFSRLKDNHQGLSEQIDFETILSRRFIITMKVDGFTFDGIKERLTDLLEQEIFVPQLLIVDGINFDSPQREIIAALKELGQEFSLRTWISASIHREEERDKNGIPARLVDVIDMFNPAWELCPESQQIKVNLIESQKTTGSFLDPSSLLLRQL